MCGIKQNRRAWTNRGELDASRDNRILAVEILTLRAEQARMHGYKSYAEYATADTMVSTVSECLW